ncbi:MAG: YbaK/EbsC family protein [Propionibacteriaceae bacterium]|jgi:prolyl-tRNA editing enzyme YbaK/EbsC (Cys-tRNA(Pro) deacylase)|nr:YbaK/EbsC family protein [Propionibacteriaceae bacterium]
MAIERARDHLALFGLEERVREFDVSSATVELAAQALGVAPALIAKTLSFVTPDGPILVVAAGDARVGNALFRERFGCKARLIPADQVEGLVGHAVGGVCPFGVEPGVRVFLDESLRRFEVVYPACGSASSCARLTLAELERASGAEGWVRVTTWPEGNV